MSTSSKGKDKAVGHAACFIAYAIFGVNIVTCKDMTTGDFLSPIAIFCLRSTGAGALFWLLSLLLPAERVDRGDYVKIFVASMLGFFGTQLTFLMAIRCITPVDCSIVGAISPILTMLIAAIALKEPITLRKVAGVVISFCGIVYLIVNSTTAHAGATDTEPAGLFLIFCNCLFFSLYLGIFKPLIVKYHVVTFMKWIFLFSAVASLPFAATELVAAPWLSFTPSFVAELLYLIIGATFVSYFLIPIGQKRIRPTLVSMYTYVQPIIAIVVSIYIGMDTLSWQKAAAAFTVFAGVVLVSLSKSAKDVENERGAAHK